MSVTKGLSSRTLFNVFSKIISSITYLILNAVSSRVLGPELYGETQYIIWFAYTAWVFSSFGIPTTIIRYLALGSFETLLVFLKKPIFYLSIAFILVSLATSIWYLFPQHFLLVFCLCLSVGGYFFVQAIFEGLFLNRKHFIATFISSVVTLAPLYPLVTNFGFDGYIVATILMLSSYSIIGVVLIGFTTRNVQTNSSKVSNREIIRFSFYTWLAAIISIFVWQRMEIFFLNKYLTAIDVAYFSVAISIANIVSQPIIILSSALTPYFSLKLSEQNSTQIQNVYFFLTKLYAWVVYFFGWFCCFNSEWMVVTIFGEQYRSASMIVAILAASAPISAVASVGSSLLYGYGRSRFIAISSFVGAVLAVVLFSFVTPRFGLDAVGFIRVILQATMIVIGTTYIIKSIRMKFPLKEYLLSLTVAGGINYTVSFFIYSTTFFGFVLFGTISLFSYLLISYLIKYFTRDDIAKFKDVFHQQLAQFGFVKA